MSSQWERKLFEMAEEERITVPDSLNERIEGNLLETKRQARNTARRRSGRPVRLKKALILAAAMTMLFSITATAAVSAWRQRMEAMNQEKLEEYFAQIYTAKLPSDNYNRPLSESERSRMETLAADYEGQGRFPQGELVMLEEAEDYKGKSVGFLGSTGTFFLPEKEMSDEELLQIVDFRYKRDYSLQKMNEMIDSGQAQFPEEAASVQAPQESTENEKERFASGDPGQELTLCYTGDLSITSVTAGNDCLFLSGWNTLHRMEFGSSDSTVFFDDFEKESLVTALCQDQEGQIYLGLVELQEDGSWGNGLWMLDRDGNFLRKIDLAPFRADTVFHVGGPEGAKSTGQIWHMAVDGEGYLYLRGSGFQDASMMLILDRDGNLVSRIDNDEYHAGPSSGLGTGGDQKVYTALFNRDHRLGIASINPQEGTLEDICMEIVPEDTISFDVVGRGYDADFVMWGYSGLFSYNKGDPKAELIREAWETPCEVEGSLRCALPDGRILLVAATEYRQTTDAAGTERNERVPEKTYFYYLPGLRGQ